MDLQTLHNLKVFLGRVPTTGVLEAAALVACAVAVDSDIATLQNPPAPPTNGGEELRASTKLSLVDRAA